jgi:hypothetical protein
MKINLRLDSVARIQQYSSPAAATRQRSSRETIVTKQDSRKHSQPAACRYALLQVPGPIGSIMGNWGALSGSRTYVYTYNTHHTLPGTSWLYLPAKQLPRTAHAAIRYRSIKRHAVHP